MDKIKDNPSMTLSLINILLTGGCTVYTQKLVNALQSDVVRMNEIIKVMATTIEDLKGRSEGNMALGAAVKRLGAVVDNNVRAMKAGNKKREKDIKYLNSYLSNITSTLEDNGTSVRPPRKGNKKDKRKEKNKRKSKYESESDSDSENELSDNDSESDSNSSDSDSESDNENGAARKRDAKRHLEMIRRRNKKKSKSRS